MNGARQSVPTAMERGSSSYRRHRHIARWVVNTGLSYTHTAHHMSHERSEAERAHSHGARQQQLQEAQAYSKVRHRHIARWALASPTLTLHTTCHMNGARQSVPTAMERGSSSYRRLQEAQAYSKVRHRHIARWTLASPTLTLHTTCHMNGARQSVPTAMERGSSGYRRHRHIASAAAAATGGTGMNTGLSYTHTAHHMSHERSEAERAHSHGAWQQRLQEEAYINSEHWLLLLIQSQCTLSARSRFYESSQQRYANVATVTWLARHFETVKFPITSSPPARPSNWANAELYRYKIVAASLHKTHICVVKSLVKIAAVSWHSLRWFIKPAPGVQKTMGRQHRNMFRSCDCRPWKAFVHRSIHVRILDHDWWNIIMNV